MWPLFPKYTGQNFQIVHGNHLCQTQFLEVKLHLKMGFFHCDYVWRSQGLIEVKGALRRRSFVGVGVSRQGHTGLVEAQIGQTKVKERSHR